MSDSEGDFKRREEAKRNANWDPAARWKVIQATLAWAEQQATVRRNTPEACLAEQRRKLSMTGDSRS